MKITLEHGRDQGRESRMALRVEHDVQPVVWLRIMRAGGVTDHVGAAVLRLSESGAVPGSLLCCRGWYSSRLSQSG